MVRKIGDEDRKLILLQRGLEEQTTVMELV